MAITVSAEALLCVIAGEALAHWWGLCSERLS
jgi:hypothetical protein